MDRGGAHCKTDVAGARMTCFWIYPCVTSPRGNNPPFRHMFQP